MRALLWLLLRTFRGRLVQAVRLLRQPKYLAGLLIGLGYFGWVFAGPFMQHGWPRGEGQELLRSVDATGLLLAGSAILALVALVPWILLPGESPIRLNAAEIHTLFPAPLSRRAIVNYALLKTVPASVIAALVLALVSGMGWTRFPALLVGFLTWDLFGKLRNLWKLHPGAGWGRRAVPLLAVLYLAIIAVGMSQLSREVWGNLAALPDRDAEQVITVISDAARGSWLHVPLLPFRVALAPVLAATPGELWVRLIPATLLLVLLHAVVVASQVRFEDAALAWEQKRHSRRTGQRGLARLAGRRRSIQPFPLGPRGAPEAAVLWKNLLGGARVGYRDLLAVCLAVFLVAGGLVVGFRAAEAVRAVLGILAAQVGVFGVIASASLGRRFVGDLKRIEVVRTWPLRPTWFAVVTTLGCAAPGLALALIAASAYLGMEAGIRVAQVVHPNAPASLVPLDLAEYFGVGPVPVLLVMVFSGVLVVTGLATLVGALQTLATLLFPGWALLLADPRENPAVMGQRILVGVVMAVVLVVALLPAALLLGVAALAHHFSGVPVGLWEVPVAAVAFLVPVAGVAALLCRAAGSLWTRLDPSAELLQH